METLPWLSTIAGEQPTNRNVRLESEQQTPMLCTDFFLRNNSDESFCFYMSETYLSFIKMALAESKKKNICHM